MGYQSLSTIAGAIAWEALYNVKDQPGFFEPLDWPRKSALQKFWFRRYNG